MKNTLLYALLFFLGAVPGRSTAQSMASKKILIVYLSRTNNTRAIAEIIRKNVGGTLVSAAAHEKLFKSIRSQRKDSHPV
jgi:ribosomal protein L18